MLSSVIAWRVCDIPSTTFTGPNPLYTNPSVYNYYSGKHVFTMGSYTTTPADCAVKSYKVLTLPSGVT